MKIVLLGAGGHASDVLAAIEAFAASQAGLGAEPFTVLGYLADGDIDHSRFTGRNVQHLGAIEDLPSCGATHYVSCVGYPAAREKLALAGEAAGLTPYTVIHPRAWVPPTAVVGAGSVVLAESCLSPRTTLGIHVLVGQGAILGHDCQVGNFASVMPSACVGGDTRIGKGALVGANSTVIEKRTVGDGAAVGAGAVVTRNVSAGLTVIGNPARPMGDQ